MSDQVREVRCGPLLDPSGTAVNRAPVVVAAVLPKNPWLADGAGQITARTVCDTNLDGIWRAWLLPSSAYSRVDAYYIADQREAGGGLLLFRVPDEPGPHNVHDLLITPPPTGDASQSAGFALDALVDVSAPPTVQGLLERQLDGRVRPVTRAALLGSHINDPEPHPAYDDLPDLTLIFRNRMV